MYDKYKKILGNAPDEKAFKTAYDDIRSLRDLRDNLITIGKPFYDQFINKEENHFANWIESVFEDTELAFELRKTNSYGRTVKILNNRLKYLELWLVFNGDKEVLTKYLVNGPISLKRLMQAEMYEPKHHNFETVLDYNEKNVRYKNHEQQLVDLQQKLGIKRSLLQRIFRK